MESRGHMAKLTIRAAQKAAPLHVRVWDDDDCGCYRATAEDGWCLEPGLHEFVSYYDGLGGDGDRRGALEDIVDRLDGCIPEPCEDPKCDWCCTVWLRTDSLPPVDREVIVRTATDAGCGWVEGRGWLRSALSTEGGGVWWEFANGRTCETEGEYAPIGWREVGDE
jgi:hypothetical protein